MNQDIFVILTALSIYAAGAISPGPSFTLIVRLAAAGTRPAALGATLGFSVGAATYAIIAMAGFALFLTHINWLMNIIQIAGGCYLVWLGLTAWLSQPSHATVQTEVKPGNFWSGLYMGLLVELSNPKSLAFFMSIFAVAIPLQTAFITKTAIVFGGFLIDIAWYGLAAIALSAAPAQIFYRRFDIWIERGLGTILAGFGISLIFTIFISL